MRTQQGNQLLELLHQLNEVGQHLTQPLDSPDILQNIVDQIRNSLEADLVIL